MLHHAPTPADPEAFRRLRAELRQTVQAGGLSMGFAPRVALASGKLCGLEAQLRWPRKRGAGLAEASLQPLLDECGLAPAVSQWALTQACRHAIAWQDIPLCVTLAGGALHDGALIRWVSAALEETGLHPERLEIAIPETMLCQEPAEALLAIGALRDLGTGVALDGFGNAGGNLMTLKRLPLTLVRLDRGLVRDAATDADCAAFLRATATFAHALDMRVAAKGVDTQAIRDLAASAGCDAASGAACGAEMAARF